MSVTTQSPGSRSDDGPVQEQRDALELFTVGSPDTTVTASTPEASLGETLTRELAGLLDAAIPEIEELVNEITPVLVLAAAEGDDELTSELESQLWAIVEMNRIRTTQSVWRVVRSLSRVAMRGLAVGATALRGGV